ncbi:unnamed protein product [Closterium sp. NIES-54]
MHLCAELHAEQQEMDLFEERNNKRHHQPVVLYTNRRQPRYQNRGHVPPYCHLCRTSGHTRFNCPQQQRQYASSSRPLRPAPPHIASTQQRPATASTTTSTRPTTSTSRPAQTSRIVAMARTTESNIDSCITNSPPTYSPDERPSPPPSSLTINPTYAAIANSASTGPDTWFLDSCCGHHMCSSSRFLQRERRLPRDVIITVANNENLRTNKQGIVELQSNETNVILQLNKVLVVDNLGFNLLSVSQLMSKGIHLECTADSDGIVAFAPWTHPPDLDPNFSPEGFWYSRTIPEAERTNALAVLQTQEPTPESVPLIEATTTIEAVPPTTEPVVEEPPVVRGFDQEFGRDFTETFAPVSRHTSLRILLAVAASRRLPLRQIDVTNAFLYAPVDVDIFVEQPHGFIDDPSLVCQLLKSLYGIKQAPRLWQQYLHARLKRIGFDQLPHDQGMYRLTRDNDYVLLIVYVDDLLYIGSTTAIVTWFEKELQTDLSLTVSPDVTHRDNIGSSRDNIDNSRDNIDNSRDNIGSRDNIDSRDNIGSSNNNYNTNRGFFNGTNSH